MDAWNDRRSHRTFTPLNEHPPGTHPNTSRGDLSRCLERNSPGVHAALDDRSMEVVPGRVLYQVRQNLGLRYVCICSISVFPTKRLQSGCIEVKHVPPLYVCECPWDVLSCGPRTEFPPADSPKIVTRRASPPNAPMCRWTSAPIFPQI